MTDWVTFNDLAIYFASVVAIFGCGVASNTHSSNQTKGRYILLGSLFWPLVIVWAIFHVVAVAIAEVTGILKENFWDIF